MNADGSNPTRLTDDIAWDSCSEWSPDGQQIAFTSDRNGNVNIYVMDADGNDLKQLTDLDHASYPAWSPDGRRIAFMSVRRLGDYDIYVMNADGSDLTRLAEGLDFGDWADWDGWWVLMRPREQLSWSPNGEHLLTMSGHDGSLSIYVVNADGGGLTRLTDSSSTDWFPSWSPDGRRIAFCSNRESGDHNYDIYVMDAEGSNLTRLAEGMLDEVFFPPSPAWSPDGQRIAFVSNRDGGYDIYVVSAAGNRETRLTHDPEVDENPMWSPDGAQIAFTSRLREDDDEIFGVYVVNADGTGLTRLSHDAVEDFHPVWSPR